MVDSGVGGWAEQMKEIKRYKLLLNNNMFSKNMYLIKMMTTFLFISITNHSIHFYVNINSLLMPVTLQGLGTEK